MWSDVIARRIFDRDKAKYRQKAKYPINPRVFREKTPHESISVDFKTDDNEKLLSQLGHQHAENRNREFAEEKKRQFYGWALIKTKLVIDEGRSLDPDPIESANPSEPDNPYHALIKLNIPSNKEQEWIDKAWTHHIQELASRAFKFLPTLPKE